MSVFVATTAGSCRSTWQTCGWTHATSRNIQQIVTLRFTHSSRLHLEHLQSWYTPSRLKSSPAAVGETEKL